MVLVMGVSSPFSPAARLLPRGLGYGVLWLVRAETGGSSETALLLLTLRWNEKSRGLGGDGGETRLGQASRVIARRFGAGADVSGAAWYGAERGCD